MLFSLLSSVALTFAWLWFFVRRDRYPEPAWLLARTFAWGMVAWIIATAFETSLGRMFGASLTSLTLLMALLTALLEEGSKFLAASTAITEASFDEPMDGLVYAVTAALGFALMENVTYALGFGTQAATWHALLTTLAHALFSAPQGYALGGLHWQRGRGWVARVVLISALLHFLFNGILAGAAGWPLLLALGVVVSVMIALASRYYFAFEEYARKNGPPVYYRATHPQKAEKNRG